MAPVPLWWGWRRRSAGEVSASLPDPESAAGLSCAGEDLPTLGCISKSVASGLLPSTVLVNLSKMVLYFAPLLAEGH